MLAGARSLTQLASSAGGATSPPPPIPSESDTDSESSEDARKQPCVERDRVAKVTVEYEDSDFQHFQVKTLTMDPAHRDTGLPLRIEDWGAEHVFMITTHKPGPKVRKTLVVSEQCAPARP